MSKSNKRKSSVLNNASQTKRKRRSDADSSIDSDTQDDSMVSLIFIIFFLIFGKKQFIPFAAFFVKISKVITWIE